MSATKTMAKKENKREKVASGESEAPESSEPLDPQPPGFAEEFPARCNLSRLDDIATATLRKCGNEFPSLDEVTKMARKQFDDVLPEIDGAVWKVQLEYGRPLGSPNVFVNMRMPNHGFVYNPSTSPALAPMFRANHPTEARHNGIPGFEFVAKKSLFRAHLPMIITMFRNWINGHGVTAPPVASASAIEITIKIWYNAQAKRVDIELYAQLPERSVMWGLRFEPWSPWSESAATAWGADQFAARLDDDVFQ
eukprot:m.137068 g.137068  ORF g.137068 m.137068 type:complete len:252 (-) comp9558_c0_seq3:307-1062(-)